MFEVVTAVAWDECEGIVIVTIVLVGACVCDTVPKMGGKKKIFQQWLLCTHYRLSKTWEKVLGKVKRIFIAYSFSLTEAEKKKINLPLTLHFSMTERARTAADLPAVVAEEMVFVAKIGATVAAATGVPVLKIVFCGRKTQKQ